MKEYISWEQYQEAIDGMVRHYEEHYKNSECGAIYGLPRGGLPIAVSLSHRLNLPLLMNYYDRKVVTDKKILIFVYILTLIIKLIIYICYLKTNSFIKLIYIKYKIII